MDALSEIDSLTHILGNPFDAAMRADMEERLISALRKRATVSRVIREGQAQIESVGIVCQFCAHRACLGCSVHTHVERLEVLWQRKAIETGSGQA
jgi:hypothetical protein